MRLHKNEGQQDPLRMLPTTNITTRGFMLVQPTDLIQILPALPVCVSVCVCYVCSLFCWLQNYI